MSKSSPHQFIVTAEHASDSIPPECGSLLDDLIKTSETHRVFDPGTLAIAKELSARLSCSIVEGKNTRLAVDLNRSIGNPSQFSPPILDADESLKQQLLANYFIPFRSETKQTIETLLEQSDYVVHLSIHSFTKTFDGVRREVDLGILFDENRSAENALGRKWTKALRALLPQLTVKSNEPYHGSEDGHTTALRRRFPEGKYIGIELEFSQDLDLVLDAESYAKILATTLIKLLS